MLFFFCLCSGDHRDLNVLTHAFPTRRSSDLAVAIERGADLAAIGKGHGGGAVPGFHHGRLPVSLPIRGFPQLRSEEHTSELQSLMRISYDVFCLKKKTRVYRSDHNIQHKTTSH